MAIIIVSSSSSYHHHKNKKNCHHRYTTIIFSLERLYVYLFLEVCAVCCVFMYLYIPEFVFKFVLETVELLPTERRLILRVSNKFRDDEDEVG